MLVDRTSISAVDVGVDATNAIGTTNLTVTNNSILTSGSGAAIAISANANDPGVPVSRVSALVVGNRITASGTTGISLTTVNPPAAPAANPKVISISNAANAVNLGVRNFGTAVDETPAPDAAVDPPQPTLIQWGAALPALPPTPPILTAP